MLILILINTLKYPRLISNQLALPQRRLFTKTLNLRKWLRNKPPLKRGSIRLDNCLVETWCILWYANNWAVRPDDIHTMRSIIAMTYMWRLLLYLTILVNRLKIIVIRWCRKRRVSSEILMVVIIYVGKVDINSRFIPMLCAWRHWCLLRLFSTEGIKCCGIERVKHASLNRRDWIVVLVFYYNWTITRVFNYLHDTLWQ